MLCCVTHSYASYASYAGGRCTILPLSSLAVDIWKTGSGHVFSAVPIYGAQREEMYAPPRCSSWALRNSMFTFESLNPSIPAPNVDFRVACRHPWDIFVWSVQIEMSKCRNVKFHQFSNFQFPIYYSYILRVDLD